MRNVVLGFKKCSIIFAVYTVDCTELKISLTKRGLIYSYLYSYHLCFGNAYVIQSAEFLSVAPNASSLRILSRMS